MALASRQRIESGKKISVSCLDFERALLVSLPGESFVGYQLMAQRLRPDVPVVCFGYGECWTGYIPTRAAFADGFTDQWLWVDRGADAEMRTALVNVLRTPRSQVLSRAASGSSGSVSHRCLYRIDRTSPLQRRFRFCRLPTAACCLQILNLTRAQVTSRRLGIVARRSSDGGNTWSEPEILQDNVGRMNVMSATLRRFRAARCSHRPVLSCKRTAG